MVQKEKIDTLNVRVINIHYREDEALINIQNCEEKVWKEGIEYVLCTGQWL